MLDNKELLKDDDEGVSDEEIIQYAKKHNLNLNNTDDYMHAAISCYYSKYQK